MMLPRCAPVRPLILSILGAALFVGIPTDLQAQKQQTGADDQQVTWDLDRALEHLTMYPNDTYLQYVAMQLARRQGIEKEIGRKIAEITNSARPEWRRRQDGVNLFSLFTGTLAIQESLQLEAMAGGPVNSRQGRNNQTSQVTNRPSATVAVETLQGPQTKSHPWQEMLAGREPKTSQLAKYIPEDQYYIRFQSVDKLLQVLQLSDQWGEHLISQTARKAYSSHVNRRLMRQLAVETNELLQPFYDLVVTELAATGNDLYLTRGSDITLLFRYQQPLVFNTQMETFLANAIQATPGAKRSQGKYRGIEYESVTSPDRRLSVYSAYVGDDLHLRSNSLIGLQRVIDTFEGDLSHRRPNLSDSDEFKYIRTLMPFGAKEEDGLIYLSDPFIRRLTGPTLKLTERRRVISYNHLKMIAHACALFETEHGRVPKSLAELIEEQALPAEFGSEGLLCPSGGTYSLGADGRTGVSSHCGTVAALKPCCEIAVENVSEEEAKLYREFVESYERYWRTFFDPIAIRVSVEPDQFRMETIILPLINNSIYQGMAATLGEEPTPIDVAPVPKRNIFSIGFQFDKERMLKMSGWEPVGDDLADESSSNYLQEVTQQRMRQVALAMHNYHDANQHFPPLTTRDKNGKELLSWRVQLLPYLGEADLYKEFHLDEPWSSAHNRKLIEKIPAVFTIPGEKKQEGRTTFQGVIGEQTLFPRRGEGTSMQSVTDGTSNTIMFVDTKIHEATIWTRPDDLKFEDEKLAEKIIGKFDGNAYIAMGDGSVRRLTAETSLQDLRFALTKAGGENRGRIGERINTSRRNRSGFAYWLTNIRDGQVNQKLAYEFYARGIKNQMAFHVYDSEPTFDFQLIEFLGQMVGSFSTRNNFDSDFLPVFMLIASLNSPVYASIPLDDVAAVDEFMTHVDDLMAPVARRPMRAGWFQTQNDFYKLPLSEDVVARTSTIGIGPIKWRFFWARIENFLYVSSKPEVLQDLVELHKQGVQGPSDEMSSAHAMVRIRPENWNETLSNFRLGWAESHRQACFDNIGRLSSLRSLAVKKGDKFDVESRPESLYGLDFYCPCGGSYFMGEEHMECTVHGSAFSPRQALLGHEEGAIDEVLDHFAGLTIGLKFLEDGLHATMKVERK